METSKGSETEMGLPAGTRIGGVSLVTGDAARLTAFYGRTLGLRVLGQNAAGTHLGPIGGPALLTLTERPGARPPAGAATGLYHLAVLLPTRADLARAFAHMIRAGAPFSGFSDHRVSEALYLNDPDDNGIEVYRDRPRSEWAWQGEAVAMTVDPLDTEGLLAESGPSTVPWGGMPTGTTIGHVHLKVNDLMAAEGFYHGLLGFDITTRYPGAVFVSAGGYHHHLGLNTWQSRGAAPRPQVRQDWTALRFCSPPPKTCANFNPVSSRQNGRSLPTATLYA